MRNKIRTFLLLAFICTAVWAGDSINTIRPQFISISFNEGFVLPTKNISPGGYKTPGYSALTLKYGLSAKGNKWEDYAFGMPYRGIGVYAPRFYKDYLGDPFSIFLFQGARLKQINSVCSFNYEINLGASFNLRHYDVEQRPWLTALGSSTNVHLAGNWYFKWRLSRWLDLHTGLSITHFSNGALRTPNNGVNSLSAFVELAYHINPGEEKKILTDGVYSRPKFKKNRVHDVAFMFTTRTLKVDTAGTDLISKYPKERFKVAGVSYSYMLHNTRRFMFGPSVEMVYDESANAVFAGHIHPDTNEYFERVKLAKLADRFSLGLSLKGEVTMPGYSIFANVGYDVYSKNKRDLAFYQIYGLKVYLSDKLFATFGVRSTNLTRSQYLYLNIGYTFRKNRLRN